MQFAITALAVIAGLIFSLAVALLVEEFIFGKVFLVPHAPGSAIETWAETLEGELYVVPETPADVRWSRHDCFCSWNPDLRLASESPT